MHGNRNYQDDEEAAVRDGRYVRVSMFAMDSLDPVQRAIAADAVSTFDASAHRPGYRGRSPEAVKRLQDALQAYDDRLSNAWRNPGPAAPDAKPAGPAATGDARADAYAAYDRMIENRWRGAA
jgi:hypothetical protein